MAKFDPGNIDPRARIFSRGNFYTRLTRFGWVAQKWPRKRGKPKSPYDFYRQTEFGWIARQTTKMTDLDVRAAYMMAQGSEQVARDLMMQAMQGLLYEIELEDLGITMEPGRMTSNPQYILDLITETVGSLIWRSPVGWVGIPPGINGQVLTIVNNQPQWSDASPPAAAAFDMTDEGSGSWSGVTTYAGQNIGTAAADRYMIVAIGWSRSAAQTRDLTAVSLGGVALTKLIDALPGATNFKGQIWAGVVPNGVSGDLVMTFSGTGGTGSGVTWAIIRATGYVTSPVNTGTFNDGGVPNLNLTGTAVVAVGVHNVDNSNPDFTGATILVSGSSPGTEGTTQIAADTEGPSTINQPAESGVVRGCGASFQLA